MLPDSREERTIQEAVKTLVDQEGRPCFIIEKVVGRRRVGNRRDYLVNGRVSMHVKTRAFHGMM